MLPAENFRPHAFTEPTLFDEQGQHLALEQLRQCLRVLTSVIEQPVEVALSIKRPICHEAVNVAMRIHGVSKKLLPLVRLKGIGRVRAQVLYNSGFTTQAKLKRANLRQLTSLPLIGPRLSKSIKEQVGGLVDEAEWKRLDTIVVEQSSLTSFVEEEYEEEQDDD